MNSFSVLKKSLKQFKNAWCNDNQSHIVVETAAYDCDLILPSF